MNRREPKRAPASDMANIFGGSRLLFLIHFLVLIVINTVVVIFSFFFVIYRLAKSSRQVLYDLDFVNSLSKTTVETLDCFQSDNVQQTYQYLHH